MHHHICRQTSGRLITTALQLLTASAVAVLPHTLPAQDINLTNATSDVAVRYYGYQPNSAPHQSLAPAGDYNSDGYDDFVLGSPIESGVTNGASYLARGAASGFAGTDVRTFASNNSKGFRISGSSTSVLGLWTAGAGDFNGDGHDDFILGSNSTTIYVVFGGTNVSNLNLANFQTSNARGFKIDIGDNACGIGDINNDGFDDIAVAQSRTFAAPGVDRSGKVYVIFGRSAASNISLSSFATSESNGFKIIGNVSDLQLGYYMGPAGDCNGDGYADFIVGGLKYVPFRLNLEDTYFTVSTPVLLVLGKSSGFADYDLYTSPYLPDDCVLLNGSGIHYQAGRAPYPSRPGYLNDFNGDGFSDIVVSSWSESPDGATNGGAVYVAFGRDDNTTNVLLSNLTSPGPDGFRIDGPPGGRLGRFWSWAGDTNGDGNDDLLLHAANTNTFYTPDAAGPTYVIYGKTTVTETLDIADNFTTGTDGFRIDGAESTTQIFPMVSAAGDVNGDGLGDFLVGGSYKAAGMPYAVGSAHLVFGRQPKASVVNWLDHELFTPREPGY